MPWLILVSLLWAPSPGLISAHLAGGVDPALVSFVRMTLALAVLAPFFRTHGLRAREMFTLALIGAVQFGVMYVAYTTALGLLESHMVAVLTILTPFFVCLLDDVWVRRVRAWPWLGALLATVGAGVIVCSQPLTPSSWRGIALVQLSNLCFAFGQVAYRRWRMARINIADAHVFALLYAGAVLVTLPFAAPALPTMLHLRAPQWGVLVFLGLIGSGLCFFLWNYGAARTSAGVLAVMNNAKIPLMVACSLLFFDKPANLIRLAVGGGLIAAALVVAEWATRWKVQASNRRVAEAEP
jgi:drug/metabolite transporter (DMT)-like permease